MAQRLTGEAFVPDQGEAILALMQRLLPSWMRHRNRLYEWLCTGKWRWGGMTYLNGSLVLRGLVLGCATLAAGCTTTVARPDASISPRVHYVAMGSSFAASPGVTTSADQPPTRCARSVDNYAHLLARKLELQLTDVSCSGATTAQLLNAWGI